MINIRRWSARHARFIESVYEGLERILVAMHPFFTRIGYQRLEKPTAAVERVVKGFLFDTKMCGSCTLGATGMVCPMNCPKRLRNGPCGGVRTNGNCEVKPEMPCVWMEAYHGSLLMKHGERIRTIQAPVDHRLAGTSSWLREVRRKVGTESNLGETND
jgi:hypothetical protein